MSRPPRAKTAKPAAGRSEGEPRTADTHLQRIPSAPAPRVAEDEGGCADDAQARAEAEAQDGRHSIEWNNVHWQQVSRFPNQRYMTDSTEDLINVKKPSRSQQHARAVYSLGSRTHGAYFLTDHRQRANTRHRVIKTGFNSAVGTGAYRPCPDEPNLGEPLSIERTLEKGRILAEDPDTAEAIAAEASVTGGWFSESAASVGGHRSRFGTRALQRQEMAGWQTRRLWDGRELVTPGRPGSVTFNLRDGLKQANRRLIASRAGVSFVEQENHCRVVRFLHKNRNVISVEQELGGEEFATTRVERALRKFKEDSDAIKETVKPEQNRGQKARGRHRRLRQDGVVVGPVMIGPHYHKRSPLLDWKHESTKGQNIDGEESVGKDEESAGHTTERSHSTGDDSTAKKPPKPKADKDFKAARIQPPVVQPNSHAGTLVECVKDIQAMQDAKDKDILETMVKHGDMLFDAANEPNQYEALMKRHEKNHPQMGKNRPVKRPSSAPAGAVGRRSPRWSMLGKNTQRGQRPRSAMPQKNTRGDVDAKAAHRVRVRQDATDTRHRERMRNHREASLKKYEARHGHTLSEL